MLQRKDINKISELKNGFTHRWFEPDFISSSLKCFTFSNLCNAVSQVKVKEYSFEWVFPILLSMPFTNATTVNSMLSGCIKEPDRSRKRYILQVEKQSGHLLVNSFVVVRSKVQNHCKQLF
jgi:hypothetical protein